MSVFSYMAQIEKWTSTLFDVVNLFDFDMLCDVVFGAVLSDDISVAQIK